MIDWVEVHVTNAAGYLTVVAVQSLDIAEWLEYGVTVLGIGALAWYNIERALKERKERNKH